MNRLNDLLSKCKACVSITVNQHRNYHESASAYLKDMDDAQVIEPEILQEMIKRNTVVELHFYPNNPVGSYMIYHYDLGLAVEEALTVFD